VGVAHDGSSGVGGARPLGRRLHEWRTGSRLSFTAAAGRLGVHPTSYQRWEQGRRPYPRHFAAIAAVLDDSVEAVSLLAGPHHRRPGRAAPPDASLLTRARLAAGMNRVELGRALHVGPAAVYQWERGNVRPAAGLLPELARTLGLSRRQLDDALADHPPCRHDGEKLPTLGAVLRRHGLSRLDVGRLLGIAGSTTFEWETGRRRVPSWAVRELSHACRMDPDLLLTQARRAKATPSVRTLAGLRRRVHMSQKEAAAVLGVSATTLARYESGQRSMRLPAARALARLYRVPLSRVLEAAGLTPPAVLFARDWRREPLPIVLLELRRAAGLSMTQVARLTGVSHSTVRRWESGESTPGAHALAALELHYQLGRRRLTSLRGRPDPMPGRHADTDTLGCRPFQLLDSTGS
jgi:transcriptional regulator with XRE-family HTH domain